ncbi:hypothetical protein [Staphylococcus warneri]|uniref:hypothetical protein n=1 Tax=Staphylococcus warneri TaxID=1292 RepID=UPI00165BF2FD|nr:hypothetical protein [Staphylococcus warneri]QNQ45152.1 hypothetical protein IAR39_03365 [Staphylococcus warneri]
MPVTLSQDTYDAMLDDLKKLRERDVELERKAQAFDEIKEYTLDKIELLTTRQEFASNSNEFERFGNLLTAFKAVKYKIIDLEREE